LGGIGTVKIEQIFFYRDFGYFPNIFSQDFFFAKFIFLKPMNLEMGENEIPKLLPIKQFRFLDISNKYVCQRFCSIIEKTRMLSNL